MGGPGELLLLSPDAAGKDGLPPRVLPLLCADLKVKHGMHQHMHLLMLKGRWQDVLRVKVTTEDARELILVLFAFMARKMKDTLGEAAAKHVEECAKLSFTLLYEALCTHHAHSAAFTQAMSGIMQTLRMTATDCEVREPPMERLGDYRALRRQLKDINRAEKLKTRKRRREELNTLLGALEDTVRGLGEGREPEPIDMENLSLISIDVEAACLIENSSPDSETVRLYLSTLEGFGQEQRCAAYRKRVEEVLKHLAWEDSMDIKEDPGGAEEAAAEAAPAAPESPASADRRIAFTPPLSSYFPTHLAPDDLFLDAYLNEPSQRVFAVQILKALDFAGMNVRYLLRQPNTVHQFLPHLFSSKTKVYRDFLSCTQRPKCTNKWGPATYIHMKTNIKMKSDIMYRFLVEGYNYGTNGIIHSDIVGYAHRKWTKLGRGVMAEAGWPEGWDQDMAYDYMNGAQIDQYYSSDGYVVIRLQSRSFFCVGFSVSAWLVVHDFGAGYHLTATIHHQDNDL
eukprot:TRINITY_DN3627_c0_g1_i1.p1 TRINITY_DN3627_c0_g1~~TRINITY_DN3627_c0_g1_i1.p1  ORF type:complete len:532 (+),score=144.60 TRINITY_DN3627_c0_g1_i1:65-1597(+)